MRGPEHTASPAARDYFAELGVPRIINAAGTYTMLTGSIVWPEVMRAMTAVSGSYVRMDELHDAVGRRIAGTLGCEAAMVTSGAFAALTLGTAACMTAANPDRVVSLPNAAGMKDQVIVQRAHRVVYDHAVRNCGVHLIEVESQSELERAIGSRTALLLFLNKADSAGQIRAPEFIEVARQHGVPTLNDAAGDVPPVDRLFGLTRMGFDLVAFSGGKGLRGPQNAGLLLGRADLIAAARLNTYPKSDAIGRGLKVSKETMVGMLAALEEYLRRDHAADWAEWEARIEVIRGRLTALPDVRVERFVPVIASEVPHARVRWDARRVGLTDREVAEWLSRGTPPIEVIPASSGLHEDGCLEIASWTLGDGEAEIVARRIGELLRTGAETARGERASS